MSRRVRLVAALAVLFGLTGIPAAEGSGAATSLTLTLDLNANGILEVILDNGTLIRTASAPGAVIPPGSYQTLVNDDIPDGRDGYHMFHLSGPGVNLMTDLLAGDNRSELYGVTLQPNSTYTFGDDRQPDLTHVVFSTSSAGSSGGSSVSSSGGSSSGSGSSSGAVSKNKSVVGSAILPFRGTLDAVVAAGKLTLTRNGSSVSAASIKAGRYKVAVDDLTPKGGFTVQRVRKQPLTLTGGAFVGKRSATVDLTAGQWLFYSVGGAKKYFIVVA